MVSIRSPHRSKGRHQQSAGAVIAQMFQSAPLTEARGDRAPESLRAPFNSVSIRSPHRSKGRPATTTQAVFQATVSIRSPHRSKGRQHFVVAPSGHHLFQSAPLTEARGDSGSEVLAMVQTCFNPLPSPKQGETLPCLCNALGKTVSIRSPHRSKGRRPVDHGQKRHLSCFNPLPSPKQGETQRPTPCSPPSDVSIRSPHRSKGRPRWMCRMLRSRWSFQSAPLTEARGDCPCPSQSPAPTEFQSAPLTEARGDFPVKTKEQAMIQFQSAPLTEARGDQTISATPARSTCFNPLPSPKQGETRSGVQLPPDQDVSIRSPHRSKGRQKASRTMPLYSQFQSAPLTEARGDPPCRPAHRRG